MARRMRERKRLRRVWLAKRLVGLVLAASSVYIIFGFFGKLEIFGTEAKSDANPPAAGFALTGEAAELTSAEKLEKIRTSAEYPEDMVALAQRNEEAINYVYDYPRRKGQTASIDLSAEASSGSVPLLMQWDARWGYLPYGDGLVGYTGCGPVSLSMAALYLTGDPQWTPDEVVKLAIEHGYCVPGSGTSWTMIGEGSGLLGLHAEELPLAESVMREELGKGNPIIVVVGPGDFTDSGHFMVIVGCDEEGFQINDPNSCENSEKTWSYDVLSPQIQNLWAVSKA